MFAMTIKRLVLTGLFSACATAGLACGESSPTPSPDGPPLSIPDALGARDTGLPDIAQGGPVPDAAPPVDMAPPVTADAAPGVDMALAPDLPPDMPSLPPDAPALPPDAPPPPPPDAPPTVVMVTNCSQINCPSLTALASQCNGNDTTCVSEVQMTLPMGVTNYCHSNQVKKYAVTTYSGPNGENYNTVMEILKPSGEDCYTLELSGSDNNPLQNWIFKSPAGQELARAIWNESQNQLTLTCGGVSYIIGDVGCPGTDGQPEGQCTPGTCD